MGEIYLVDKAGNVVPHDSFFCNICLERMYLSRPSNESCQHEWGIAAEPLEIDGIMWIRWVCIKCQRVDIRAVRLSDRNGKHRKKAPEVG